MRAKVCIQQVAACDNVPSASSQFLLFVIDMDMCESQSDAGLADPVRLCKASAQGTLSVDDEVTVCVVCCSSTSHSHDAIRSVCSALSPVASIRSVVLSTAADRISGVTVVQVPEGTKLSKIRRLAPHIEAKLVCICDPDLSVDETSCRAVLERAVAGLRDGEDVVAFGIVEGRNDGSTLSQVIGIDKWLSHYVLRKHLWSCGIGISLPGQFLIVSSNLLRALDPRVDSYLDDLYLGLLARTCGFAVHRVSVVVGQEDPRGTWGSLVTQRLRWMKGLARIVGNVWHHPAAIPLLVIHYFTYHGLPILAFSAILYAAMIRPISALVLAIAIAIFLARASRHSIWGVLTFLIALPLIHGFATLLWWIPVKQAILRRR